MSTTAIRGHLRQRWSVDGPSMMFYLTVISIITQLFTCVLCQSHHVSVHSAAGNIIGVVKSSTFNSTTYRINTFLGIPYAEPPVGSLRFSKPVQKTRFLTPYSADQYGPSCPQNTQFFPGKPFISEDCLSLNVFAPASTHTGTLPVMVWFH